MAEEMHSNKARIAMFFILATMLAGAGGLFVKGAYAAGTLTVNGYALDGRPLSMWVVISQSGTTVKTGFTPLTFAGAGSYTVQAHDYSGGSIFFDHWDSGNTARTQAVTLGFDVAVTAYYRAPPPPNRVPVAVNDTAVTDQDRAIAINALANDSDPDGDSLALSAAGTPAHGTAAINANNTVMYRPAARFSGQDSFSYTVSDGKGGAASAVVSVQVNYVNYQPVAGDQSVSTSEDASLPVTLAASDANGDSLTFSIVAGPAHGTLASMSGNHTTYTPNADYNGQDGFTFKANDGTLDSNTATVAITVSTVNDAPVASGQSVSTSEDVARNITLTASDVDGDALLYSVSAPLHGSLAGTAPNLTYTPDGNYNGPDSFTFKASDGTLDSSLATVSITVAPVNDSPIAGNDSATTNQDTPIIIGVLSNDSDVDGDALKVASTTAPAHGSASVNADNTVTYMPAGGFSGSDSFSYTASDGRGGTGSATVAVVTVKFVPSTYALTVSSADMYGKPTGGLYTVIKQGGSATAKTGFTTLSYAGGIGATYSVTVSDYGSTLFDHWDNGSTARARTVTLNGDTAITAVFRVPTVKLSPTSGPNGTLISAAGTYFTPGSSVSVTYDGKSVASATTNAAGAFSASFAAPALGTGFHTVQATDGKGWKASAKFEDTTPPPPHPLRYLIPKNGIYVALYMYPAAGDGAMEWQKVVDAKKAHPSVPIVAAFNPSSGPGTAKDTNIATWVAKLKSVGVIMIGYTHDGYGSRPLADLKADADKYRNWYNADGLFIDEFTNKVGYEQHYRDLTAYAKSTGMKMTMGNPGTDVPKSYVGAVDVLNITEGRGYMPMSWLQYCVQCSADQGWHYQNDSLYFSYIRYDIPSLDTAFETESAKWVGLLYITDGNDSDGRWFHLPPYFSTEVATLDR